MIRYPRLAQALASRSQNDEDEQDRLRSIGRSSLGSVYDRYPRLSGVLAASRQSPDPVVQPTNRFVRGLAGAARTVAGALEPFQALKDPFDALVAGSLDPDTTVAQRLSLLDPVAYLPFGRAPQRAATGAEILELMGVSDERARSWGGFVWDVAADPLLAGTFFRVGGTLARSQRLVDIGTRLDEATSLAAANRGLNRMIPFKQQFIDDRVNNVMNTLLNTRVAWSRESAPLTYGDYFLSRTEALERQMGTFGRELFGQQALSQARGRDIITRSLSLMDEAEAGVLGSEARPWFKRAADIISRGTINAEASVGSIPAVLRDTIFSTGYDVANSVGIATTRTSRVGLSRELFENVLGFGERTVEQRQLLDTARNRVRDIAIEAKFDPDEAVRRFDGFTSRIIEADALLGYHLSGFDYVKKLFYERMQSLGMNETLSKKFWNQVLRIGMQGKKKFSEVTSLRLESGLTARAKRMGAGREIVFEEVFGKKYKTLADVLNQETSFRGLQLEDYLRGLQNGHMRRSYALFQDQYTFEGFVKNLETGRLLPNNIIDDKMIDDVLPVGSVERQAFDAYRFGTSPLSPKPRGVVLRQASIFQSIREALIRDGMEARDAGLRAREVIDNLILRVNEGPNGTPGVLKKLADDVRDLATKYEISRSSAGRAMATSGMRLAPGSGEAFYRSRENLAAEVLDTLGELAIPQISIRETSRFARRQLPWNTYVSEAFALARRQGYVSASQSSREGTRFVKVPPNESVYGPFADTYVHPFLKKEIDRAMRERTREPSDFGRIRALLTGGYLASPNVITANLFGGLYTSSLIGLSPIEMVREMAGSYTEFRRASASPSYRFNDLEDLRNYVPVNDTTLVSANVEDAFSRIASAPDLDPQGARALFDNFTNAVQKQLDAPLGQRWAGLDGFQFVENWLKVAAYRARRNQLALRENIDPAEWAKPRAERSAEALRVEAEAAEAARIAVFDYSEIPEIFRLARDTGILLFPGFSFFLTARNLRAAFNNPGPIAAADRISDAVNNAQMDEDTKVAVYGSMPEWLRDEQGTVMPWLTWTDGNGNVRRSVIPMNQLVPTNSFIGNPWAESLSTGGIYKPLIEMVSAFFTGTGEAPFSQRYGQMVFEPSAEGAERVAQGLGFLVNNLMPGGIRKLASYQADEGFVGLIPSLLESSASLPPEVADSIYSVYEIQNRRAERTLFDQATGMLLRSPQVVLTGGPLANVRRNMEAAERELNTELASLRARLMNAQLTGRTSLANRLRREIAERQLEFANEVAPILNAIRGVN